MDHNVDKVVIFPAELKLSKSAGSYTSYVIRRVLATETPSGARNDVLSIFGIDSIPCSSVRLHSQGRFRHGEHGDEKHLQIQVSMDLLSKIQHALPNHDITLSSISCTSTLTLRYMLDNTPAKHIWLDVYSDFSDYVTEPTFYTQTAGTLTSNMTIAKDIKFDLVFLANTSEAARCYLVPYISHSLS